MWSAQFRSLFTVKPSNLVFLSSVIVSFPTLIWNISLDFTPPGGFTKRTVFAGLQTSLFEAVYLRMLMESSSSISLSSFFVLSVAVKVESSAYPNTVQDFAHC